MLKIETKNGTKSLLDVTHDEFIVPKGQEQLVHYTAERVRHDVATGKRLSEPQLMTTNVKMFDSFQKTEMEKVGYTIYILHHPKGKYVEKVNYRNIEAEIADKDARIAELEAKLAEKTKTVGRPKKEE